MLTKLFKEWCALQGYFPEPAVYVRDESVLHPQCARLVRLHSSFDERAGNPQHYVLEARFGASELLYPLGHKRRDLLEMEAALRSALAQDQIEIVKGETE